jgi:RNA polymerase sigma-70 factor (ECF subfamily)
LEPGRPCRPDSDEIAPPRRDDAARHRFIVELYAAHARVVRSYIAGTLRAADDVDDVLQDLFLRIIRLEDPFRLQENPRGYLFKAARNLVRDRARHARYCRAEFHEDIEALTLETDQPSPEHEAARKSDMAQLMAVLAPDERARRVVVLSVVEDLTYPEIAERLRVTTRTIERCMQRVRQVCQPHLDPRPLVELTGMSAPVRRKTATADSF